MINFHLANFRAFKTQQTARLKPLTLISGSNNSGKTSILAAVRYVADLSPRYGVRSTQSFNKEPFSLGSFDQIAFCGDADDRPQTFTLGFDTDNSVDVGEAGPQIGRSLQLTFGRSFGQPRIVQSHYTQGQSSVEASVSDDGAGIRLRVCFGEECVEDIVTMDDFFPGDSRIGLEIFLLRPDYFISEIIYRTASDATGIPNKYKAMRKFFSGKRRTMKDDIHNVMSALNAFPSPCIASAPFRSKPSRTYEPVEMTDNSFGDHVPTSLSRLKATSPAQWKSVKAKINQFGRQSGLFQEIEIKSLGDSESDPFQVNFRINGKTHRNIADVGYGVSQALPIIYDMIRSSERGIYLLQQPEVHLHPEAQAAFATFLVDQNKSLSRHVLVETHSEYIIDRIGYHIKERDISAAAVGLVYVERVGDHSIIHNIDFNDDGMPIDPPECYRSFFRTEHLKVLGIE